MREGKDFRLIIFQICSRQRNASVEQEEEKRVQTEREREKGRKINLHRVYYRRQNAWNYYLLKLFKINLSSDEEVRGAVEGDRGEEGRPGRREREARPF